MAHQQNRKRLTHNPSIASTVVPEVVKLPTVGVPVLAFVNVADRPVAVTLTPPPLALKQSDPHDEPPLLKDTEACRDGASPMHNATKNSALPKAFTFVSSGRLIMFFIGVCLY